MKDTVLVALVGLVSSSLGSVGAFCTAFVVQRSQEKRSDNEANRRNEENKDKSELERLDELYKRLSEWTKFACKHFLFGAHVLKGSMSYKSFIDLQIASKGELDNGTFERIDFLVRGFFPELEKQWSLVVEKRDLCFDLMPKDTGWAGSAKELASSLIEFEREAESLKLSICRRVRS